MPSEKKSLFVYKLARAGAASIGVVYVMLGVVAILSLLRLRRGGAAEASILTIIANIPLGEVILAIIFLGLVAYIIWKFYNAIVDPYGYGKDTKGMAERAGIAAAGLAYGMIAYSAVMAFLDIANSTHGQPDDQRQLVDRILQWCIGEYLVGGASVLVAITGVAQFIYVFKKGYREKLSVSRISKGKKKTIAVLAWAGHFARGIILIIIAWFLMSAAIHSNPDKVVNTDKAFNFLGEQIGNLSFVLVAAGTICYGFYMFMLSLYYDFEDDF